MSIIPFNCKLENIPFKLTQVSANISAVLKQISRKNNWSICSVVIVAVVVQSASFAAGLFLKVLEAAEQRVTDCDTSSLVVCRTDCSQPRAVTWRPPPVSSLTGPRNARSHKERSVFRVAKSSHNGPLTVGLTTWYCVTQFCSGQRSKERRMRAKRLKWNGHFKLVRTSKTLAKTSRSSLSSLLVGILCY